MPDPKKTIDAPTIHRMEGELKVCDPVKTDHTRDMESWRIFKIMAELVDGFDLLRKYKLAASIFGSARDGLDPRFYKDAEELARRLALSNFVIITGGAGGIMQSGNHGAKEAGGKSVGLTITLVNKEQHNPYLTDEMSFSYFFVRRVMLAFASEVYIFFPGGFGTLDEFFEILTLVQTKKIKRIPIVLYGKDFWAPLIEYMKKDLLEKHKSIAEEDLKLFVVADTVDEAYEQILISVKC
jgi:hypothetical protein